MDNETLEQARLALEADRQTRIDEFAALIQSEAQRLRVNLIAEPIFTNDGRIVARVRIVAE